MIVVDSSAWVDAVIGEATPTLIDALASDGHWVVPEHFHLEALSALRGRYIGGKSDDLGFARAVQYLAQQKVDVWPTVPLIPRIVSLTRNATTYDAAYLALAEELGCPLVTADVKLSRVPGIHCRVVGYEA